MSELQEPVTLRVVVPDQFEPAEGLSWEDELNQEILVTWDGVLETKSPRPIPTVFWPDDCPYPKDKRWNTLKP